MWPRPWTPITNHGSPLAPAAAGSPADDAWKTWKRGESSDGSQPLQPQSVVLGKRTPKMARVEAVLLVAGTAVPPRRLAQLATLADATEARTIVGKLNAVYQQWHTPFRVEKVAAGYRMFTLPQYALWLGRLHHRDAELKLSPPALETLTVIAYRQPITRADIEAIRGVQCSEMIRQLMERSLVRIGGTDDALGRPFLFVTTPQFLESFGLQDLTQLPMSERLRKPTADAETPPAAA
ncbi:MAG TPA: SMC-Scp complex subunit ScpB [Planctomycetaceae bacterium]|jgi:segregation and condensation protein B|nr:SMC-Scp complex subunit ScpB [Planctomycetaceae bacterium]